MATCLICLKNRSAQNIKFSTPRMKICRWCVRTLNRETWSVTEAEVRRAAELHTMLFHRNMALVNSGDPVQIAEGERKLRGLDDFVEQVRRGGFSRQCLDPRDNSVEIKIIRAFKKGLILHGRQYAARPKNWAFTAAQLKHRDQERCNLCGDCGDDIPEIVLHAHHIVHRSYGGSNNRKNLVVLCYHCHQKQHPDIVITRTGGEPDGVYDAPEDASEEEMEPSVIDQPISHPASTFQRDLALFVAGRGPDPREAEGRGGSIEANTEKRDDRPFAADAVTEYRSRSKPASPSSDRTYGVPSLPKQPAKGFDWRFWAACIVFFLLFKACRALTTEQDTRGGTDTSPVTQQALPASPLEVDARIYLTYQLASLTTEQLALANEAWLASHPELTDVATAQAVADEFGRVVKEQPRIAIGNALDTAYQRVVGAPAVSRSPDQ